MIHLDYRDCRPIYSQIYEGFRSQIRSGILAQGDKLPSVRELATQLAINPNTIQRAYRELEMEGYIASIPGKGSFVCSVPTSEHAEQQPFWDALDAAAEQLTALGVTKEAIIQHFRQGGKKNA
ncbi:MAG: GntR family transcriptional regulator [Oscillospiraceae bacterium]|nr:GntR family transcriptional regulator [Oscillospiraceae bacterium]